MVKSLAVPNSERVSEMRKTLLLCCVLLCLASTANAQYSNASLNGPWLVEISGVEPYDYSVYLIFNGQGSITDMGVMSPPDSIGWYSVAPNGAISGFIWSDGYVPFTGQMQTDSTAVFHRDALEIPLLKVMNLGACSGCWQGQFVQDGTNVTYDVVMAINPYGELESCVGFAAPVEGLFYHQSGCLAGHLTTGETEGGWNEIMFLDTHMVGDSIMAGTYGIDCTACNGGSFELTRMSCCSGSEAIPALTLRQNYPNPFNPSTAISFVLNEPAHVKLAVYDVTGRLVRVLIDEMRPEGTTRVEWDGRGTRNSLLGSGVYYCLLQADGRAITKTMVLLR
jgi:hypothetical protein